MEQFMKKIRAGQGLRLALDIAVQEEQRSVGDCSSIFMQLPDG